METCDIPGGTVKIALTNAFQYLIVGLFYIIVTASAHARLKFEC